MSETLRRSAVEYVVKIGTAVLVALSSTAFPEFTPDPLGQTPQPVRPLQAALREEDRFLKESQPAQKGRNRLNGHSEDRYAITPWTF